MMHIYEDKDGEHVKVKSVPMEGAPNTWIVWPLEGGEVKDFVMEEQEARAQAERLAKENPGKVYFLYKSMAQVKYDIQWEEHLDHHEMNKRLNEALGEKIFNEKKKK